MKSHILLLFLVIMFTFACSNEENGEFTGAEVTIPMIAGEVQGNTTSGMLTIKERSDGSAQIEIIIQHVLRNSVHPIHLHYGSLDDDGNVATLLTELREENGIGKSVTILSNLENGERVSYQDLLLMDASIKIHFEPSGPLENELIASTNIGLNQAENAAYINGSKSITECNDEF
jgi:hypothetical protein